MTNFSVAESLTLERLDDNLFRGHTPPIWKGRIFGGQVIAQALIAAYATVENRPCHSLHAYFLRPGDPTIPIIFEVDRARDLCVSYGMLGQLAQSEGRLDEARRDFEDSLPIPGRRRLRRSWMSSRASGPRAGARPA